MQTAYLIYAILTFVCSLLGGIVISKLKFSHTGLQILLSFVGGLMLAVAILHLLPHSVTELKGNTKTASVAMLAGILITFLLLRVFQVHQHGAYDDTQSQICQHPEHRQATASDDPNHCEVHRSRYSWIGLFIGLGIHALIDGLAISAIVVESTNHTEVPLLPGIALAAAILLHKPLDSMSVISVMKSSGWDQNAVRLANFSFALISPLGIYIAAYGFDVFAVDSNTSLLGWTFGISAGCFITIALSDILPELTFHNHDRLKLTIALILGVALGFMLQGSETTHDHTHHHPTAITELSTSGT